MSVQTQPSPLPSPARTPWQRDSCVQVLSPGVLSDEEQTLQSCQEQVWAEGLEPARVSCPGMLLPALLRAHPATTAGTNHEGLLCSKQGMGETLPVTAGQPSQQTLP